MRDKSINLFNKSWLMHWVANFEKSIELIEEAEKELKGSGFEVAIVPKGEWIAQIEVTNEINIETTSQSADNNQGKRNKIRTREQLIIQQAKKIYELSNRQAKKVALKKLAPENSISEPFLTDHSDTLSCLSIKSDVLTYEVRLVVNIEFSWVGVLDTDFQVDGTDVSVQSANSHEVVLFVDNHLISGEVHFSSLGVAEGVFYEQRGSRAPDRRNLATTIMKSLAMKIYVL